ncbi:MAG: hypothetical protein ABGY24_07385 [bacterium]|jgi:hypothetical protein
MSGMFKMGDRMAMGMFLLLSGATVVTLGMTSVARTKGRKKEFDALMAGVEERVSSSTR